MTAKIRCLVHGRPRQQLGAAVRVRLTVRNSGNTDLWILKRNTPLDDLPCDCWKIRGESGRSIAYDGPLIRHGPLTSTDFVLLSAGHSLSVEADLSQSYSLSKPGSYDIVPRGTRFQAWPADKTRGRSAWSDFSQTSPLPLILESRSRRLMLRAGAEKVFTAGQIARRSLRQQRRRRQEFVSLPVPGRSVNPLQARCVGGTLAQQTRLQMAHAGAYASCRNAVAAIANDSRYQTWFGSHTARRAQRVASVYQRMIERWESETFVYDLRGKICGRRALAYTFKRTAAIWLCPLFWKAPAKGADSQVAVLVHEHSHCSGATEDLTYGRAAAQNLARRSPQATVRNADSYEFYAMD